MSLDASHSRRIIGAMDLCPRHRQPGLLLETGGRCVPYGVPLCSGCFREAVTKADDILLEEKLDHIYALRLNSVDALMQRLGWKR